MILSFVIPAYNEEKTLEEIVKKVLNLNLSHNFSKEIIIVNDASKDNTAKIAEKLSNNYEEVKFINNEQNLGKSQSVRKGILASTGDYVVIQDADLEYDPEDISRMVTYLNDHKLDVAYGNRFGKKSKVIYWQNYIGNKMLSFISNIFTYPRIFKYIPDMEVCYKLVDGSVLRDIAKTLTATSNFGFEPEVTVKLSKYKKDSKHLKFGIYPISYFPRSVAEGKKMKAFRDGFKALGEILRYNFSK